MLEKKNNLFDESIRRKIERQRGQQPAPKGKSYSYIKIIAIVFAALFVISILIRFIY